MLRNTLGRLAKEEDGAVTVDWVVLTAAIVLLAVSAILILSDGTRDVGETTSDGLTEIAGRVSSNTVLQ